MSFSPPTVTPFSLMIPILRIFNRIRKVKKRINLFLTTWLGTTPHARKPQILNFRKVKVKWRQSLKWLTRQKSDLEMKVLDSPTANGRQFAVTTFRESDLEKMEGRFIFVKSIIKWIKHKDGRESSWRDQSKSSDHQSENLRFLLFQKKNKGEGEHFNWKWKYENEKQNKKVNAIN